MTSQADRYVLIAHWREPVSGDKELYLTLSGDRKEGLKSRFNIDVVPYHWNDRQQFNQDCTKVQDLYERYLNALVGRLNEYHHTNFSERYWRIIIGPWLYPTIALLFDRWSMIDKALSEFSVDFVEIAAHDLKEVVQIDFSSIQDNSHQYNEAIYAAILKYRGGVKLRSIETIDVPTISRKPAYILLKRALVNLNRLLGKRFQPNYFFHGSCLPMRAEFAINLLLRQLPTRFISPEYPFTLLSLASRESLRVDGFHEGFDGLINEIIPKIMPKIYLEGYQQIVDSIDTYGWPKKPKLIFTSISYNFDEIFKIWTAFAKFFLASSVLSIVTFFWKFLFEVSFSSSLIFQTK